MILSAFKKSPSNSMPSRSFGMSLGLRSLFKVTRYRLMILAEGWVSWLANAPSFVITAYLHCLYLDGPHKIDASFVNQTGVGQIRFESQMGRYYCK